jgi:recombinational DNA repair ATPase RecF
LDDVFAELDGERQRRLAARLLGAGERQIFITSPRRDELPANLDLPVWVVENGRVR